MLDWLFEKKAGASDTLGFVGEIFLVRVPRKLEIHSCSEMSIFNIPKEVQTYKEFLKPSQMRILKFTPKISSPFIFIQIISTQNS